MSGYRGGSRILCRRGADLPGEGGHQHMILSKFPKNCMKLRNVWTVGGACTGRAPLDLPLGYHTDTPIATRAEPSCKAPYLINIHVPLI